MLGHRSLAWVDKRIQQATGKLSKPFGGISLMILGDFAQLPPVGDKPIYASPSQSSSLLTQYGHSIYGLFETVVMLKTFDRLETILRQNNFKQYSFAYEMVSVLKMTGWHCQRTPQHVNMSDFTDAPRLYFDTLSVAKYNFEKLRNLRSQIARISALHSVLHSRYKVALVLQRNCTPFSANQNWVTFSCILLSVVIEWINKHDLALARAVLLLEGHRLRARTVEEGKVWQTTADNLHSHATLTFLVTKMLHNVIRYRTRVDLVSDFPPCVIAPQLMICSNKDAVQRT